MGITLVCFKIIYSIVTCLLLAHFVSSDTKLDTKTCCTDGFGLNYTLPMFNECKKKLHPNGSMVQTIPKLIPTSSDDKRCLGRMSKGGIPPGYRVCNFPDCDNQPCENGWCEETITGFRCHCNMGFQGTHCDQTSDEIKISTEQTVTVTSEIATTGMTASDEIKISTEQAVTVTSEIATTASDEIKISTEQTVTVTSEIATTGPSAMIFVTDPKVENIFVSKLQDKLVFTPINSTIRPRGIAYDSVLKKIYWTDGREKRVYRADINGTNMEAVTQRLEESYPGTDDIAIANTARIIFISYFKINKITSTSIAEGSPIPGNQTNFITDGIVWPRALVADDEQGYLYWSMDYTIARTLINGSGSIEVIYTNPELKNFTGLTIDLTREVRRIFFCEHNQRRTFYKDILSSPNTDTSHAVELSDYLYHTNTPLNARHLNFFNGALYWIKLNFPMGVAVLTDYDQSTRSYKIQEIDQFVKPYRMCIAYIED